MKKIDPPKTPEQILSEEERQRELEKSKTPSLLQKKVGPIRDLEDLDGEEEDEPEEG